MYLYIIGALVLIWFMWFKNRTGESTIQKLVKNAAKWATTAQQDESPMMAMLHANYASGYLWALKDIAGPKDIQRITGVDFKLFEEHILGVQDQVTKKVTEKCPEFVGQVDLYLATIAN